MRRQGICNEKMKCKKNAVEGIELSGMCMRFESKSKELTLQIWEEILRVGRVVCERSQYQSGSGT